MYTLPEFFHLISSFNILSALKQGLSFSPLFFSCVSKHQKQHSLSGMSDFVDSMYYWEGQCRARDIHVLCFYAFKSNKSTIYLKLIMIPWAPVLLIDGLAIKVYIQYSMMQPFARQAFAQARVFSLYSFP